MKHGLFNNGVFQILEDDAGAFWMTSNRGIHRVSKEQLNAFAAGTLSAVSSSSYGKSDGMLNEECNGGIWPAGIRARDGKLWLPTQDGVAVIDPKAVAANTRPPTVRIESGALDGSSVPTDRTVRILPGQENLEIRYTAVTFINAERMVFRYRLDGIDRDWVYAGTRRLAHYAHIPPGNYGFSVLAANSDGVWTDVPATLDVVVLPPYWQTWTFPGNRGRRSNRPSVGICVPAPHGPHAPRGGKPAGVRAAADRRAGGGAAAHRNRAARRTGTEPADRAQSRTSRHGGEPERRRRVRGRAPRRDRGDGRRRHQRGPSDRLQPPAVPSGRLGLPQAIEEMVARVSASSSLAIQVDVAALEGRVASDAAINCYRIVQESLSNVVRHAGATTASIRAAVEGHDIRLTIVDNGTGFDVQRTAAVRRTGGLGMVGVAERARMLGGSHTVTSRPGAGTTITIRFPVTETRNDAS